MPSKGGTLAKGGQWPVQDQRVWRCFSAKSKNVGQDSLATSEFYNIRILQLQSHVVDTVRFVYVTAGDLGE